MKDYKMTPKEIRATWSLGLVFSLRMLGVFTVIPALTMYGMTLQGANEFLIGIAVGIYSLMQAIFQIPLGLLSDRIGRKPLIIYGILLFIIGSITAALSYSIWGIIFGRALQGTGSITSTILALLSDLTRDQHRTKAMAIIGICFSITFAIAMIAGPIIVNNLSLNALFWIIATLAVISIILTIWIVPNSNNYLINRDYKIIKSCFSKVIFNLNLMKFNFSIMCLHILMVSNFILIPKQLMKIQPISVDHWKVYSIITIISLILSIPFVIYAEKKRHIKFVFLLGIIFIFISEIIFYLNSLNFLKIFIGMQLFFLAFNVLEALLPSLVSKESPAGYKGTAMGIYSTSQFTGIAIGSFFTGWINNFSNSQNIFLAGILLTIIWLILIFNMKEPQHVISLLVKIPKGMFFSEKLKTCLKYEEGVKEMLIIHEEFSIYFKIDDKITNRAKLEKILKTF